MKLMRMRVISSTLGVFLTGFMNRSYVFSSRFLCSRFLESFEFNTEGMTDDSQVIYHYIQRDLDNCASKLARERQIHPADWRVLAGAAGCTGDEQYQSTEVMTPLFEPGSFYAAATKDTTMARSYYGTHLPDLLFALGEIVGEYGEGRMANLGPPVTRVEDIPDILYKKGV